MHADGGTGFEPVMEVVALHHARHGVLGGELDHAHRSQGQAPFAVVADLGFFRVEHQRGLLVISFSVFFDLLWCERRTGTVAARRVANQTGEVADQENDLVPQILQLAHFVEHHGMTDMDIWRCGI